jgi:hypothetical protein
MCIDMYIGMYVDMIIHTHIHIHTLFSKKNNFSKFIAFFSVVNMFTQNNFWRKIMAKKETKPQEIEIEEPIGSDDEYSEDSLSEEEEPRRKTVSLTDLDHNNLFAGFDPNNDVDNMDGVTRLDEPPTLDGRGMRSSMFGNRATTIGGRSTSPKLLAQASNMPNCTQLRVWKWENGVPVGLGAIDSQASEEDFVREFLSAMPKVAEGKCQYRLRPIDINGNELGTEISLIISEHHMALQKFRRMKQAEDEDDIGFSKNRKRRYEDDSDDDGDFMTRYSPQFDRIMSTAEKRAESLERQLEMEREELRKREELRMQDQVDLATNTARGVQVLTERIMADESKRAERAMQMQTEQSQTLVTTLTSIFAQQQSVLQAQMETQRRQDEYRLEQERQRYERERAEQDARRERERLELEERRYREREEYERKMREERENIERKIAKEQKELEIRLQREREEMQLRVLREKEERESREKWFAEERSRREQQEREDAKQREYDRQRQHERMMRELEIQQQKDREHAERMMVLSKQEMQNKTLGGIGEMLPIATGLLKQFGLEPKDVVSKIFTPEREEKESGWAETLPKLLGAGADIARVALSSKMTTPVQPIGQMPQALPPVDMSRRRPMLQDMGTDEDIYPPPRPQRQPIRQAPEGSVISFRDTSMMSEQQAMPQSPIDKAGNAGMTLSEQRDARNALQELVGTLHSSDRSQWEDTITQAIMAEPQIYNYIQAVSVRYAIRESGADNTLTENIVQALKQSSLVPTDLNFGE